MLPNDLRELLLAFNEHGVEYLLVGGYAVGVYAEPRATKDLDIFVRPERLNSEAAYHALAAYGAPLTEVTPADFCNDPDSVFQIGQPPLRIDLLQKIDGVTFDEAWSKRTEAFIDGVPVHVISAEHLIRNKLASGRLQDLADAEAVRDSTRKE
ncbi:MAG: nucleotidyltransferase [Acidobacteriaceae bacterium]